MSKERGDEGLISRSKTKIKSLFLSNNTENSKTYTGVGRRHNCYKIKQSSILAMLSWRTTYPNQPRDSLGLCGRCLPLQYWAVQHISERYCGEWQDVQEEVEQDLHEEEGKQLHAAKEWCGGAALGCWK